MSVAFSTENLAGVIYCESGPNARGADRSEDASHRKAGTLTQSNGPPYQSIEFREGMVLFMSRIYLLLQSPYIFKRIL